jgi:5-methylcytosine-specific restriction endonuclease McrA
MNIRQALKNAWDGFLDLCNSLAEAHRRQMETPTPCCGCQEVYLYQDLRPTHSAQLAEHQNSFSLREFGKTLGYKLEWVHPHSYCSTCWKPLQEERARVRAIISEEYARQQRLAERYPRESKLVEKHNKRALLAGGEASLTIGHWLITLEHYKWRCAYCGGLYDELEHWVPIDRGGGTTAKNCVPACQSCNRRKGALHPDEIIANEWSLSPATHRRIEAEMEKLHGTQQHYRELYSEVDTPEPDSLVP